MLPEKSRASLLHGLLDARHRCAQPQFLLEQESWLRREGLWIAALELAIRSISLKPAWRKDLLEATAWDLRCRSTLQEIGRAAELHGLQILTFKGCSLSLKHYVAVGQRSFGDIDLAVPPGQRTKLEDQLTQSGFSLPVAGIAYRNGLSLDLHEHPLHQLHLGVKLSVEDWWATAEPIGADYGALRTLPTEQEFLLALFHGAKHAFSRANWIADLWVLAHRCEASRLAQVVILHRAGRHLWLAQRCLKMWFSEDFPVQLHGAIRPPSRFDVFSHHLLRLILRRQAPDYLGMLTPIWAIQGFGNKLRYLRSALAPPKGQTAQQRLKRLVDMLKNILTPGSGH